MMRMLLARLTPPTRPLGCVDGQSTARRCERDGQLSAVFGVKLSASSKEDRPLTTSGNTSGDLKSLLAHSSSHAWDVLSRPSRPFRVVELRG